jgi:UDP-N-acetylmuramate dehydrogenase
VNVARDVPLAPLTTLELGGPARYFALAREDGEVLDAIAWADARGARIAILGGGSNLVVADRGVDAMVIAIRTRGITERREGDRVVIEAAAGEPWDELVAHSVARGLAGLECLSGIPGLTGATPIQNVGAYGQEVSGTIASVRVLDRATGEILALEPSACAFGYRDSALKRAPDRHVVLGVSFALIPGGAPTVRYAELDRALDGREPTLAQVRETVIALRRAKSMVIDPSDPNRRSAGSFFTNPIVDPATADALAAREPALPRWPQPDGRVKLAAGWLIEQSGIAKGLRRGRVGISTRHALALVHHGGGTTAELLGLAGEVRDAVRARFGIELEREPVLWEGKTET